MQEPAGAPCSPPFDVAVVGATGLVGETLIEILAARDFPVGRLRPLAPAAAAGGRVEFQGQYLPVEDVAGFDFSTVRLAFFCADESIAATHAPKAADAGCIVIDASTQFRYDDEIPLVIPEVNPQALAQYRRRNIVAVPNCTTIMMLMALKPIHDAAGLARINAVTFQSVSGTGKEAVDELAGQTIALLNMKQARPKVYPKQIAFNALPRIDALLDNGYTREEMKMAWETWKILGDPAIGVNVTAVRVPVFYGHALALHVETRDKITAAQARKLLAQAAGVTVVDQDKPGGYPTAVTEAQGQDAVYVGRIREDVTHARGLDLWCVADNTRKGSALNSVQIGETLIKNYLAS